MSTMVADAPPVAGPDGGDTKLVWRPLVRMAWRDAMRRKGRTALVVALIAVPVALLFLASVVVQSTNLSNQQRQLLRLGRQADALLQIPPVAPGQPDPAVPELPSTWQQARVENLGFVRVKMSGRFRFTTVVQTRLDDPLLAGAYTLTSGAAPAAPDTAAVSTDLARRYGVHRGDMLTMRDGQRFRVVGIFEQADNVNQAIVAMTTRPTALAAPASAQGTSVYVKAPDAQAIATWLARPDASTVSVDVARDPSVIPPRFPFDDESFMPTVILYTLGTTGLFLVGIVISAAFAVSARRQLRTLGLVAANGASPSVLGRLMAAQGVVTGAVGAIVGLGLGAGGLAAVAPHLNRIVGMRLPGLHISPLQVAVVAVMGVLTAAAAAWLPGRTVARVPTLSALGGRRPVEPVKGRVPVFGVVLFSGGLVLLGATVASGSQTSALGQWARLVGAIGGLMLGAVLCMPWLVGHLEAAARRWRGSRRLAARSLARNRARSGPIAAAILVTAGAAMAAATFNESQRATSEAARNKVAPRSVIIVSGREQGGLETNLAPAADVVTRVQSALAGSVIVRYTPADRSTGPAELDGGPAGGGTQFVTMDEASMRTLAGDEAAAAFARGEAVVLPRQYLRDGTAVLLLHDAVGNVSTPARVEVPAVTGPADVTLSDDRAYSCTDRSCTPLDPLPVVVLPDTLARSLGFTTSFGPVVQVRAGRPLTSAELQQLRELNVVLQEQALDQAETTGEAVYTSIQFNDVGASESRALQWLLTGAVLLLALGVTGIGLALTATENRADDATLLALGAPPRFRRRVRAWEALLLTGSGVVLAVPLGYVVGAVAIANGSHHAIPFPWLTAGLLAIATPLVAAAVFGLLARTPRVVLLRED